MDGYSLVFKDYTYYVFKDKLKEILLARGPMAKNKIFSFALTYNERYAMNAMSTDENLICHQRYSHLSFKNFESNFRKKKN